MWRRIADVVRRGSARVGNELAAAAFARQTTAPDALPEDAVALYFATSPDNLYQFEQWRRPLERLAERRGVFVIVDSADTGRLVRSSTALPVAFLRGSASLEAVVASRRVRVVLYVNQVESNFRMLRFPEPVHLQIGHGESDKGSSSSHQHRAYDGVLVAGQAGRDRLARALRDYDADRLTTLVGRPQLDYAYPGAPDWTDDARVVLYAPTWQGDRPSIAYGSLLTHGRSIVAALLADPQIRVIYRPHPRIHKGSADYVAADREIRAMVRSAGDRHLIDEGPYGWQWRVADACVTDISAVAYDWLATGKPLVVTEPAESRAFRGDSALLRRLPLLPAADASRVVDRLAAEPSLAELTSYYFGDTTPGTSTARFEAAIDDAWHRARG